MATFLRYFVYFFLLPFGRYVDTVFGANASQNETLLFLAEGYGCGSPLTARKNGRGDRTEIGMMFDYVFGVRIPTHRIHVWNIYLHLVDFYGTCR